MVSVYISGSVGSIINAYTVKVLICARNKIVQFCANTANRTLKILQMCSRCHHVPFKSTGCGASVRTRSTSVRFLLLFMLGR